MRIIEPLGYTKENSFFVECKDCGTLVSYEITYTESDKVNTSASIVPIDHICQR